MEARKYRNQLIWYLRAIECKPKPKLEHGIKSALRRNLFYEYFDISQYAENTIQDTYNYILFAAPIIDPKKHTEFYNECSNSIRKARALKNLNPKDLSDLYRKSSDKVVSGDHITTERLRAIKMYKKMIQELGLDDTSSKEE